MADAPVEVTTQVQVQFRDCDPLGHANHAVFLTWFENGRVAFWQERVDPDNRSTAWPFIIAEATATYRSPAQFRERLRVTTGVESVGTKSWVFRYRIQGEDGREVATGRTVQVAYDYAVGRSVPLSPEIRRCLTGEPG